MTDESDLRKKILTAAVVHPGWSIEELVENLGLDPVEVMHAIDALLQEGELECRD